MPGKTEFKFKCSSCGQNILAATEWSGRKINCPSCQTGITIPAMAKGTKRKPAPVMPPNPTTHSDHASRPSRVEMPTKNKAPAVTPNQAAPASAKIRTALSSLEDNAKAPSNSPVETPQLRIAVLTPAVKLDMVRAVRRSIANESAWLPGKIGGRAAYAAKITNGETALVDVKHPDASRFSLLGAFLRELRQRHVTRTATGRTKLIDQEIPDAARQVLAEDMSDEAREQSEAALANDDWMRANHAQCLGALDVLEERYSQRMEQVEAERARRRLGTVRLPDLVKKLEGKGGISPEDVATALYHELMDVRRRLDRLENRTAKHAQG